ncbi:hypothetical protein PR202_ga07789 [Eleusine coracana subsp. coracana]|uniref:Uncharacterized protein n=1 Tax=Eleusine coracana subsp. coracana TaxID=191504 RepID=A0AAV5BYI1_ELECO|nr:hypothetical protein PR202_ga07789 [Eleusine coracana subsp. coracana]
MMDGVCFDILASRSGCRRRTSSSSVSVSADGSETPQSNKVRSVVGRLAVRAAERCVELNSAGRRGLRVYLQDEYGTSIDALELMISR